MVYTDVVALENMTFAIVLTSDLAVPPLISAMEVFKLLDYMFMPPKTSSNKKKWKIILGVTIPPVFGILGMFSCCSALGDIGDCLQCLFGRF
ncbi:hypothetical protein CDL15_Pgr024088 [Punica granatum]|uniref:Uncharacterized protein n=1 Tax=Punica granatum TaxID=22663 RepID=A0A218XWY1_PUNGR|nr:hypothetical protein CDL15_Pgr024088 [Punica granatum]